MLIVRLTIFHRDHKFIKAVKDFGPSSAASVLATVDDFEFDWKQGMEIEVLHARYDYKALKHISLPYKIFQIRAGSNRKNLSYRAELIFYDEQCHACWIHAFKKDPNPRSQKQEIDLAVSRANDVWNRIKGEQ